MIKTQLFQLCFLLLSFIVLASASSVAQQEEHEENQECEALLADFSKKGLVSTKANDMLFNKCLKYYLTRYMITSAEMDLIDEEDTDAEFLKPREARRVKGVKNFWKRSRVGGKGKKFW